MSYPKLTQNGTTACDHFKQAKAIEEAANKLLAALEAAAPKSVDYTPNGPNAHFRATDAHKGRLLAVSGIRNHAQYLAQHVADQLQGKEAVAVAA